MGKARSRFLTLTLAASLGVLASGRSFAIEPDEVDFRAIRDSFARGDYEGTRKSVEDFESKYPTSAWTGQAENLMGLSLLATKHPQDAIMRFQRAIDAGSPATKYFDQYMRYNLARAQLEAGDAEAAEKSLAQISPDLLDKDNRLKFHLLKSNVLRRRGMDYEAARELLETSRTIDPEKPTQRASVSTPLEAALKELKGTQPLENLYKDFDDSPLLDQVLLKLASREIEMGESAKAEIHVQTLMTRFPKSELYAQAQALSRAKDTLGPADPATVGILLPLKGKFGKFGQRNLQAIEMAFKLFEPAGASSKVTLVIEDSGEDADSAVKALDRLAKDHHAIAVIGPLLSKGIDNVTKHAQELQIPLLPLSRAAGVPGEYVIPAGVTLQMQAAEVARFAVESLKLKRFAILAPRERVGEDFTTFFWDAVDALGGQVTGAESYNPGETDFRQPVDKLSGLYYTEARQKELDQLARLRIKDKIKKRTRKTEQYFSLKPVVDYDAVFIPDEPKVASQVLPTFSYRDVDGVKFLGPSAWNSPELISRAQNYAEGALFAEALYTGSAENSPARKFQERFKSSFGSDPSAMDAVAFDAAQILSNAMASAGSDKRSDVLAQLKAIKNFPGASGVISFKDGQLYHELKILTVKSGQIVEATAEKSAPSPRAVKKTSPMDAPANPPTNPDDER